MKKINFTVYLVYLLFIFVLTTALLSFGICLSSYSTVQSVTALEQQQQQQQNSNTSIFDLQGQILNSVFNQVKNSVVQITSKVPSPLSSQSSPQSPSPNPSNPDNNQNATALGSGFVYDKNGHIITNYHVVSNAKTVDVTFIDGNIYTAEVVGKDPSRDLAVLKIIENLTKPLNPLPIANSSNLSIGEQVIAIGNPYGLDNTMTTGIISQTGRLLSESSSNSIPDAIQTDAPINPGNSGGPLLNIRGQVIGVNTAGLSNGVGFAISSNMVLKETPILIEKGNITHPQLGMLGSTLTSDLTSQFKNVSKTFRGVYVFSIIKNSTADNAGLRGITVDYYGQRHGGDIITAINKQNVTKMDQLVTYVDQHVKFGDTITLTVYRDGHYIDLKADFIKNPPPTSQISSPIPSNSTDTPNFS
jgi:S1-C subfamily serine protease